MDKQLFQDIARLVNDSFIAENSVGIDFCVQLEIIGGTNENWYLKIKGQKCQIENGIDPQANAQVKIQQEDLIKLMQGKLKLTMAFFTGKIKISGDQSGLLKMVSLFNIDKEKINHLLERFK
jgi:putative sterol carrier protein